MGRDVDHRTDIFSFGAVLYEMATGRVPFSGASLTETIDRITHAQPDAIARYNYNVPAELEVIIKKALRKNRDERYQSARDLLVDLRDLERELEFASRMEHSVAPSIIDTAPAAHSEQATEILTAGQPSLINFRDDDYTYAGLERRIPDSGNQTSQEGRGNCGGPALDHRGWCCFWTLQISASQTAVQLSSGKDYPADEQRQGRDCDNFARWQIRGLFDTG